MTVVTAVGCGLAGFLVGVLVGVLVCAVLTVRRYDELLTALWWLLRDPGNERARAYAWTLLGGEGPHGYKRAAPEGESSRVRAVPEEVGG
jgi:hypothetical protein